MTNIGTSEEWLAARSDLLEREKELTRRSDELARERMALPWVPVEQEYSFCTVDGPQLGRSLETPGWPRRRYEYAL